MTLICEYVDGNEDDDDVADMPSGNANTDGRPSGTSPTETDPSSVLLLYKSFSINLNMLKRN